MAKMMAWSGKHVCMCDHCREPNARTGRLRQRDNKQWQRDVDDEFHVLPGEDTLGLLSHDDTGDPYDDGTGEIVWYDTRDKWARYWAGDVGPELQQPGYDEWDAWEQHDPHTT